MGDQTPKNLGNMRAYLCAQENNGISRSISSNLFTSSSLCLASPGHAELKHMGGGEGFSPDAQLTSSAYNFVFCLLGQKLSSLIGRLAKLMPVGPGLAMGQAAELAVPGWLAPLPHSPIPSWPVGTSGKVLLSSCGPSPDFTDNETKFQRGQKVSQSLRDRTSKAWQSYSYGHLPYGRPCLHRPPTLTTLLPVVQCGLSQTTGWTVRLRNVFCHTAGEERNSGTH